MKHFSEHASVPGGAHAEHCECWLCYSLQLGSILTSSLKLEPSALLCWGHQELLVQRPRVWPRFQAAV